MLYCNDVSCNETSCFVECNEMSINISFLRAIQEKRDRYEKYLTEKSLMAIYELSKVFQKDFDKICMDFVREYDKIIAENVK